MSWSDLIVLAPWIIFGAGLAAVCVRLAVSRRAARRPPVRPPAAAGQRAPDDAATAQRQARNGDQHRVARP